MCVTPVQDVCRDAGSTGALVVDVAAEEGGAVAVAAGSPDASGGV